MNGLDRAMTALEDALMRTAFIAALALGVAQVVMRYVLNMGFTWIETGLVALTILASLVGGSRAVARGFHVRIVLVVNALRGRFRLLVAMAATLFALGYCALLAWGGWLYLEFVRTANVVSVETGLPAWVFACVVPLTMTMFVIRYLQMIPVVLRNLPDDPALTGE